MKIFKKLSKIFDKKEFIIRKDNELITYSLSKSFQIFLALLIICIISSFSYMSYIYITNKSAIKDSISFKKENSEKIKQTIIKSKVYKEELDSVVNKLKDFNEKTLKTLEANKNISDDKKQALEKELFMIDINRQYLSDKLDSFYSAQNFYNLNDADSKEIYDINKAILQRNIAWRERSEIKTENEHVINSMQEFKKAQDDLLDKLEFLTNSDLKGVESDVDKINRTLNGLGIKDKKELQKKAKELNGAEGGLYIPLKKLDLEGADADRINNLNARINKIEDFQNIMAALPLGAPVEKVSISSPFGAREDPINGNAATHKGLDFRGNIGDKVHAPSNGKVIFAGIKTGYGNCVEVDHGLGFSTLYGHLSKILVKDGQFVKTGDEIAELGNTGRSTGPHLHYEIKYNKVQFNPFSFVKARSNDDLKEPKTSTSLESSKIDNKKTAVSKTTSTKKIVATKSKKPVKKS